MTEEKCLLTEGGDVIPGLKVQTNQFVDMQGTGKYTDVNVENKGTICIAVNKPPAGSLRIFL